jgi:tRNA (adenine57-N1/adenine58-N1)-methyltransferase catalytic subunit
VSDLFAPGDRVQLTGPKGRLNTFQLVVGGRFGSHKGDLMHDDIIGKPQSSVIANQNGVEYLALKPLLTDYVLSMPRGAAIVYPKDAGQIIVEGDIFPGATVIEAGVGSGSLSSFLLRAIGPTGKLISFEKREEFASIAKANVQNQLGQQVPNWDIEIGALQERLPETVKKASADRAVLDMLAPWECIESVADALKPGGVLIIYIATVTQLSRTVEAILEHGGFTPTVAWESMVRTWHVDGLAVRPDHRMIAHTGFLLSARRLAPGAVLPQFKQKRASKTEYTQEDMDIWLPEAIGQRPISEKKLRKTVRKLNPDVSSSEN